MNNKFVFIKINLDRLSRLKARHQIIMMLTLITTHGIVVQGGKSDTISPIEASVCLAQVEDNDTNHS